ncbi:Rne/Rng family ribonuclease [Pseudanabaena sp. FACHB-2040]|uniref:Rne/Rng family ribonuclease n=1 Tax=Pseudanabaena sp. FACHB-2040 TaxID=2692859 RepID=UPI0016887ED6|nr:Rne/Rng family ribonuclease [Pseudanabaena sp. FACHB-2040]MBD2260296.1 Rne/Rng family ribonuclease [Pseudanabaena sp. FACHB-2040]
MPKQIVIAEQHRTAAVFSEDQIQELIVATGTHQVSDIYLGTVENVLPGIDAAFINIGDSERNGFMHVSDLGPLRLKRSAGSITELVAPQQKVLVQIMKEPTGNKGPRLTGNITLPGRYLVLMPFGRGVNLSRRIRSENERSRLRALAILIKPAGMGLLVRTEAEGVAEKAIIEDLEMLQRQWENVQQQALATRPPALLNRDDDFVQRVLRDVYSSDVNRIVTDSHTGMKRVKQYLASWSEGKLPTGVLIDHHRDRTPLLEYFRVNAAIREALKPRVDLPSGGYIIIEPTEALTVIDVNSGSFTRSATSRETVLWTNCEAATEIARQLRLRNIAGVIIVDFIDMDSRRDQLQVLEHFNKAIRSDKARPQISQLSELGLVELTRKRQGQNLYELFGRLCPTCGGLGHLVHLPGENAEEVQPLVQETGRSYTPVANRTPAAVQPVVRDTPREVRGEELEPFQDLQELDLVNHPSYQERTGRGNRRRRRREPLPTRSNGGRDGATAKEIPPPAAAPVVPEPVAAPAAAVEEEKLPVRTGRSRSGNGRHEKKPVAAPQVVAVEMTPDEQRIYAMMGISPLVLANQELTDPKNTTIAVVLPGEAASFSAPEIAEAPAPVVADGEIEKPVRRQRKQATETPEPEEVSPTSVSVEAESSAFAEASPTHTEPTAQIDSVTPAETVTPAESIETQETQASEEESDANVRRRRRRRSSATATNQ